MKATIFTTFLAAACVAFGMYLGDRYLGKGDIVAALCVMGEVAVDQGYLSADELQGLAEQTGTAMKQSHPKLAGVINYHDRSVAAELDDSTCTRLLASLSQGMR